MMDRDSRLCYGAGVIAAGDEANGSFGEVNAAPEICDTTDLFRLRGDTYPWHRCPTQAHRRA